LKIEPRGSELLPRFLYHFMGTPESIDWLERNAVGSTMANLSAEIVGRFPVRYPNLEVQRRIALYLDSYDDLIANNKRRIELLEQSARLLFKEWFVHLRYPGHEHVKVVDGVPEGWERTTLGSSAQFFSGGTPSKARADFWDGKIPWVSSGELTQMRISDTSLHLTETAVNEGSRFVPADTILAVVRGMSLAKEFRIGLAARELSFNQDIKALIANDGVDPLFLYHAIEIQRDRIRDQATDASHGTKKLETPVLSGVSILLPEKSLMRSFREQVSPLHRQWDVLAQQNASLARARDLLLPRLMDGRISI
jgi:type I restriction enzyme S subunit